MILYSSQFSQIYMTETTNSQPKKASDGTSTPSKVSVEIPEDIRRAIAYLEYRKLRHKHPHC